MPAGSLVNLDVLIVDDNAHMRALLRAVLRSLGVQRLREASGGREGLEHLRHKPADIILLDLAMPEMSGPEFLRELRGSAQSPAPSARVIMITGYGDLPSVTAARDAGADEFLVKPITAQALLTRIEAVTKKPRPFVEGGDFQGPDRRRRRDRVRGQERRGPIAN